MKYETTTTKTSSASSSSSSSTSPHSSPSTSPTSHPHPPSTKPKLVACLECQRRKRSCKGLSPGSSSCDLCTKRGIVCSGAKEMKVMPRVRSGKVISTVRHAYRPPITTPSPPSSLSTRLAFTTLSNSLSYHLVSAAKGETTLPDWLPGISLGHLVGRYERRAMGDIEPELDDIWFTAMLTLGARRSMHSAITGSCASLSKSKQVRLGPLREQTVQDLLRRLIDQVEGSRKLNTDASVDTFEVLMVLRTVFQAVDPKHPFQQRLILLSHLTRNTLLRSDAEEVNGMGRAKMIKYVKDVWNPSLVSYDSYLASKLGRGPVLTQTDLKKKFGWTKTKAMAAIAKLEQSQRGDLDEKELELEEIDSWFRAVGTEILRADGEIRAGEHVYSEEELRQLFDLWWHHLDLIEAFVILHTPTLNQLSFDARQVGHKFESHPQSTPSIVECCLLGLARYLGWEDVVKEQEKRVVKWLKILVKTVGNTDKYFASPAGMHSMAIFMEVMDAVPDWVQLAFESNFDSYDGDGFNVDDLLLLLRCLRTAADIYASSAEKEAQLIDLMSSLEISADPPTHLDRGLVKMETDENIFYAFDDEWSKAKTRRGDWDRDNVERLAQRMISGAVKEVEEE